jgi:mannose-1-phosphate guanylyltransferase
MFVLSADYPIADDEGFRAAVVNAVALANEG